MKKYQIIQYSTVIIDNSLSSLATSLEQNPTILLQQKNPFQEIANPLLLKSILTINFTDQSLQNDINKSYINEDIIIKYIFFPQQFQIIQNDNFDKNKTIDYMLKIVNFANIENSIDKIGVNYILFFEQNINIKHDILKDNIAKEFTGVSITLVEKLNDLQTLNLQIAGATSPNQRPGVYITANFESKITTNNTINHILSQNQNFEEIIDKKVKLLFPNL